MITEEQAIAIAKEIVRNAGYTFDHVYLLDVDENEPAAYWIYGKDEKGEQIFSGCEIKKVILAEDGKVVDFELPPPGIVQQTDCIREYDDYPVPDIIMPLTDENREEYNKICEEIDKVVDQVLKEHG